MTVGSAILSRLPLDVAGVEASSVGLTLPEQMRVNEWERLGAQLEAAHNANMWWIADWAAYGDKWFRKEYPSLIEKLYSRQSVHDLAMVSRSVEPSRRREDLSFTHHREVSSLGPDEQTEWLADAFDEGWSTRELRERIAAWKRGERPKQIAAFTLRAPGELGELCRQAAERSSMDPVAWATSVLERAAREVLNLEAA